MISTKHLHKVAPKMNSLRRNSAKPSEKAGRIQHLVQIGFDTQITKRNLTEEGRAELYTIYQESFDKCYIPKDWKKHRERSPQDEWVLHPHNAKHCWEAHGMLCCQEICQRPQGQGDTLCKWGGGWGSDQENACGENAAAFTYDVYKGFQRKEQTEAVAIDLEDAHNRVQFKLLMNLLIQYGNSGYAAWKLELCSSSAHNGPTTRITTLASLIQCLHQRPGRSEPKWTQQDSHTGR